MKTLIRRLVLWAVNDDLRQMQEIATHNAVARAVNQCEPKVVPPPVVFKQGDRVKGSPTCGFNQGFRGEVKYIEPNGKLWIRRDGASSDVYYHPHEVEHE